MSANDALTLSFTQVPQAECADVIPGVEQNVRVVTVGGTSVKANNAQTDRTALARPVQRAVWQIPSSTPSARHNRTENGSGERTVMNGDFPIDDMLWLEASSFVTGMWISMTSRRLWYFVPCGMVRQRPQSIPSRVPQSMLPVRDAIAQVLKQKSATAP
ncbi:hypothetical protein E0W60_33535 (plasmid) [Cupriavidus oxalaticus]|uniref:Uncharacterized protein n=1 Tax=Cupriavidus oxalaticus TaxID=96344 RepID=A0A4P7LQQ3_9BURK|nr:hypothetical protein E0W60_33535 [Cupriavidus oxalaticus]